MQHSKETTLYVIEDGIIVRETKEEQIYNGTFKTKEVKEVVNIRDGVLLSGTLDKTSFGEVAVHLLHHLSSTTTGMTKGQEEMKKFIHQVTRLAFGGTQASRYTIAPLDCSLMDLMLGILSKMNTIRYLPR